MVQQAEKTPTSAPQTPEVPAQSAPNTAPDPASRLATMNYAAGKAAVDPDGPGLPPDPAALDYAGGRAAVAPTATSGDPAAAEKVRATAAKGSYQALLGQALGGKLYELVARELAPDQVLALGGKGLDAAAAAGVGAIHPVDGVQVIDEAAEAEAVRQFAGALADWAKGEAAAWLQTDDGKAFAVKVSQWFEGHPGAVVALALVAAAGAVAANASLPELQQKWKLGANTALSAGVNLNKIRDIAVKSAHLGVDWQKGDVAASLSYGYKKGEEGKADSHALSAKVGDGHRALTADATVEGDKLVVRTGGEYKGDGLSVAAGVQQTRDQGGAATTLADARVTLGSETKNVTADAKYDLATGDLAIGVGALQRFSGPVAGDVHARLGHDNKDGASVGLGMSAQTGDDLKLTLDAMLREHGASTLSASAEKRWGEVAVKGSATVDLTNQKLQQLAVEFGFRDKDSFNAFIVDYKRNYDGDVPRQELDLLVQAQLGQLLLRATSKTAFERDALRGNVTGLQAAYPVGRDVTLIGGARYGFDDAQHPGLTDRERGTWLEAGVQFKGVPIVVGYRPEDKAVTVGITIPFGK